MYVISELLNDRIMIALREDWMRRLSAFFDGDDKEAPFYLYGARSFSRQISPDMVTDEWFDNAIQTLSAVRPEQLTVGHFAPVSLEFWLYGVHFVDKLFGAQVAYSPANQVWWSEGVKNAVGELEPVDFEHNALWRFTQDLYQRFLSIEMKLPLIATQVLGSPMVGIFNLYRERILYAFYDDPAGVRRDLRVLTDALIYMHRWFQSNLPPDQFQPIAISGRCQPRGMGQMCGCTTQLISKEIYDEFIYPLDREILQLYPNGGMYHLCGSHRQHIPTWRDFPELRAIQINDAAADDLHYYFEGLRPDQMIYLNPTKHMTVERALDITGGKRLVIVRPKT